MAAALPLNTTTEQDNQCTRIYKTYIYIYAKKPTGIVRTGCDITINTLVTSQYHNYYIQVVPSRVKRSIAKGSLEVLKPSEVIYFRWIFSMKAFADHLFDLAEYSRPTYGYPI